jgi:hypothetical protein
MRSTIYKLAEYKITENEHGDLWWETHIGLGSLRIGKCFINADILFIRPSDRKGPGFLKGEFLDHINKLPKWKKTKYYCASYKIYKCKSVSKKPFFKGVKSQLQEEAIFRKKELIQEEKSVKGDTVNQNKILLILILKLLFGSFQVIYKAIRVFIGQWTRSKD